MIFILLPVYNEEKNIGAFISRIDQGLKRSGEDYLIVAYDDGSSDGSRRILEERAAHRPISIIGRKENMGLGFGLSQLLRYVVEKSESDEDIAVVLDSDNSHDPEHICRQMVPKIREGYDVVIASRYLRDSRIVGVSAFRQLLSYVASIMMRVLFPIKGVRDYTCGYRAYRVGTLRAFFAEYGDNAIEERGFACMAELLIKLRRMGILAIETPLVLRYDQKSGESKMKIGTTILRTLRLIVELKANPRVRM